MLALCSVLFALTINWEQILQCQGSVAHFSAKIVYESFVSPVLESYNLFHVSKLSQYLGSLLVRLAQLFNRMTTRGLMPPFTVILISLLQLVIFPSMPLLPDESQSMSPGSPSQFRSSLKKIVAILGCSLNQQNICQPSYGPMKNLSFSRGGRHMHACRHCPPSFRRATKVLTVFPKILLAK